MEKVTGFDTDLLGTFTRDIAREGNQLDAARKKARIGMELSGLSIGIASEGTRARGLKVINAGGANAFKSTVRQFALDDMVPDDGVSSRMSVLFQPSINVNQGLCCDHSSFNPFKTT